MAALTYARLRDLYAMADLHAPDSRKEIIKWAAKTTKASARLVERWLSGDAEPAADELKALEDEAWRGVNRRANQAFPPVRGPAGPGRYWSIWRRRGRG